MVSFLLLPAEIRDQVYKNLQTTIPRHEHQSHRDHSDHIVPASILGASKQIRAEVELVLLLENSYHHYLEQITSCKTYSSPAAEQSLARVLTSCPSLTSLHLHLILPNDARISDPVGQDASGLIARMTRTTNILLHHLNLRLQKVLLSAEKPPSVDPTLIVPGTQGASFAYGLYALREKYKEVLAPLQALPAKVAVAFGAEKPNLNGFRASSAEGYVAMCEYILDQRIDKMFALRAVAVGFPTPEAQAVAIGMRVEQEKGGAELAGLETKEETKDMSTDAKTKEMMTAEEETPALEVGV